MKRTRRTLSLLLALVMLLSILPELHLPVRAEDETDLTIDFEYEKKYNVKSREDALLVTAESQFHDHDKEYPSQPITSLTDLKNRYGEFYWQKATIWTVKDHDDRSLRKLLTSTDDKDKYIVLNQDDDHDYYKSDLWETIEITTDKVLDLNGRKIKIRYDSNRSNDDPDQTDHIEYHNCTAFRISKGATLTIIDSSAWRGENGGKGHGMIYFSAYRVNPFSYPINTYTTRDLFDVSDGNLVIYGGTFKAGNSKTFYKSKFSWEKLRTTIGTALERGVNIAEYATGLDAACCSLRRPQTWTEITTTAMTTTTAPTAPTPPERRTVPTPRRKIRRTVPPARKTTTSPWTKSRRARTTARTRPTRRRLARTTRTPSLPRAGRRSWNPP